jgi:hypothetical protein
MSNKPPFSCAINRAFLRNYYVDYSENGQYNAVESFAPVTFSYFKSVKTNTDCTFNRVINTNEFAREILNFLVNANNIKEMDIVHINSVSYLNKDSNQDTKDQDIRLFSLTNLVSNINIKQTKRVVAIDDIEINKKDNDTDYEIIMLLAMLKLKAYFFNDFVSLDKKVFNKILNSIVNIFQTKNIALDNPHSDANNKSTDVISTIEDIANNKKNFALIVEVLQKKIDFSHDSNAMQFLNIIKNIPALKELTLNTLIKKTQNNSQKTITHNEYNTKYNAISDIINNTPIDNWLQENKNIDLQTLAKRSMEFIMFSTVEQQSQEDVSKIIKLDEFYLSVLLHAASKKIDYYMNDFKKFVAENNIDKLLEKPVKYIEAFEGIIEEIRQEIKLNILNIDPATNKNTDYTIDKVVNDNVTRIIGSPIKLNPVILTIPDHPIIIREIAKNKKVTKRGYGENRCPCGSGKKLKDCCGKKRDDKE